MRSTFRILFYIKRNAPLRDGRAPIMGRITIDGGRAHFATQLSVKPRLWEGGRNRASGRSREAAHINTCLNSLQFRIERKYNLLYGDKTNITAKMLREVIFGQGTAEEGVLAFFRRHNEDFGRMVGVSRSSATYYKYRCVYGHLDRYMHESYGGDISFEKIDKKFLTGFHAYILQQSRCKKNTVWVYLIALKHIFAQARSEGFPVVDVFANYKLHSEFVMRNYLSMEEIEKLLRLDLTQASLRLIRDAFLFSCFTGLSFVDVKNLTDRNIHCADGHLWLTTSRTKTGTEVHVRLFDLPRTILLRYDLQKDASIFNLPSNGWCNRCLARIALAAGLSKRITFHTARHTFATTITLSQGVAIETISKLLGHKNIRTTQIYASVTHNRLNREMDMLSERLETMCGAWNALLV